MKKLQNNGKPCTANCSDMEKDLRNALKVLRTGGLILYPTDTVWGIGCDATREDSVERIYRLKQRAEKQSMLILVDTVDRIYSYVDPVPEIAIDLMEVADKPLSIVFSGARNLASNLMAHDGSIGIRVCRDPFCLELIKRFRKPLVSTSANLHGEPPPSCFAEIGKPILQGVDYTVTWRQDDTTRAAPSDIIRIGPGGEVKILRKS